MYIFSKQYKKNNIDDLINIKSKMFSKYFQKEYSKMRAGISARKTFIIACFGIAIGLCIGTAFKNYRALELFKKCNRKPFKESSPLEIIQMPSKCTVYNSQMNLIFVGVMTAKNFLEGRAKAVYDTWGKEVPGRIAFFSSEGSKSNYLPVIALKNVDDRYPPQKKSFMMLYYMYEHFIDKFEWFIRADDDVYIDVDKLEKFLRSIDSSKPQFIGQAGKGNSEEFGLLSLEFDENFCMGGPGVIISRETLRRVAPHISTCLKNLYSTHEDVEIGRCVQRFAGIPCTWNYEMQYILRHNSSGKRAFTGNLKRKEVHSAISLHPVKQGPLMYRLHSYIQGLKVDEQRQESLLLHRDIDRMAKLLQTSSENKYLVPSVNLFPEEESGSRYILDHNLLGVAPDLNKFIPKNTSELLEWTFIARSLYSADNVNPKRKMDSATKEGLEDAISEIMENINNFSKQRGRIIEFRDLLYGYSRLNALHGQDLILDLLLIYKKYRGKKMTVPVRRHLYVQRSFTGIFVKETTEDFYNFTLQKEKNKNDISSKVKNILNTGLEKISNSFTIPVFMPKQNNITKIVFVLPVAGRLDTFKRFIINYENVAIEKDQNSDLLIVLFEDNETTIYDHIQIINDLKFRNPYRKINYIFLKQKFSRGVALDIATRSSYIEDNDIILYIDVDMAFNRETLDRIRMNTIQGKQVYLPIVFSQYDPKRISHYYQSSSLFNQFTIDNNFGYFRQFGYGICSIYKSDVLNPELNGFDRDINGWGLEDVKFLERIIKFGNKQNELFLNSSDFPDYFINSKRTIKHLNVFRAPDPSLIHVYHDIICDAKLEPSQYNMCVGTKANTLGSTKIIEDLFLSKNDNIDFISNLYNRIDK